MKEFSFNEIEKIIMEQAEKDFKRQAKRNRIGAKNSRVNGRNIKNEYTRINTKS